MLALTVPQIAATLQVRPRARASRPRPRAGRSAEQRAAFAYLRPLAAPDRLRVSADPEGFPVIPGRYGTIEWAGANNGLLAGYTARPLIGRRLIAIPETIRHQIGDQEVRVLFPVARLPEVAQLLRARRRRRVDPARIQKALEALHRCTPRPQDRVPRPGQGSTPGERQEGGVSAPEASA